MTRQKRDASETPLCEAMMPEAQSSQYSKHPLIRTCGLRTSWQELGTLIPKKYKNLFSQAKSSWFLYVGYR